MPDVITVLQNNAVVVEVPGSDLLVAMAVAANTVLRDEMLDALQQVEDLASGAPDAPSILNKLDKDGAGVITGDFMIALGQAQPDGETGVINHVYLPGDVRRYGVFPDEVTDWEGSHSAKMTAIYANSCLSNLTIYWPPGEYHTSMNVGPTYNGSKMFFDKAIFHGIIHLIDGISDVSWTGTVSTYDRHGITGGGSTNLRFGTIICLNDPAKNMAAVGVGGRGVHWVDPTDVIFDLIDVVDCAAASEVLPGTTANLAAVWIEGQGNSGIRGTIRCRQSQTNGVFVNALDIELDIRVDGYGAQVIDVGAASLEGLSTVQTELGFGLWLHRCTGRVRYKVDQSNVAPGADTYSVVISETGLSTVAASRHKALDVADHDVTVGNANRGVCIGAVETGYAVANVTFSGVVHTRLRTGAGTIPTLASGYAGFNVLPPPAVADNYRRVTVTGALEFSNFGAVQEFAATAVATSAARNYTELNINGLKAETGAGKVAVINGLAATGGVLTGRLANVIVNRQGGSATGVVAVDIDGTTAFSLEGGTLKSAGAATTAGLRIANNVGGSFAFGSIHNFGDTGNKAALTIEANTGCTIGPCRLSRSTLGLLGVVFVGSNVDCTFRNLIAKDSLASGFDNGTGMAFSNPVAIGCIASGNTLNTDLTTAHIPAANQLGCLNFAV